MITAISIVVGLALLFAGGEGVVRGSVGAAQRLGVSPFVIGLTIVGFATSLPELVVSLNAALIGAPGVAIGNIIGSNIANILLILAAAAVVLPIRVQPQAVRQDGAVMLAATMAFVAVAFGGVVTRPVGAALTACLVLYLAYSLWADRRRNKAEVALVEAEAEEREALPQQGWVIVLALIVGLAALVGGARLFVDGATGLARASGVPDEVIGLTLVAVGTSLPELAASLVAAWRGHSDVALGNVLGSNVFNLLGILGITAAVSPLPISDRIIGFDLWALVGATFLLIPVLLTGTRVTRAEGVGLLCVYAAYIGVEFLWSDP